VLGSQVPHEIRVTVDPTVHTGPDVIALVTTLRTSGASTIALQEARPQGTTPDYTAALAGRRLQDLLPHLPEGVIGRY
jgi:pyruvate formate lyase activating enzyme